MTPAPPHGIDVSSPSDARVYDYMLGGRINYAVDRKLAEEFAGRWPQVRDLAKRNRAFLGRAVRFLAGEAGVRQFLDLGAGLPTEPNVHQIVASHAPGGQVVYVDNDPAVIAHGRALLEGTDRAVYVESPIQSVDTVLTAAEQHLDLSQPVGLICATVLHYVPDEEDPAGIMREYVTALCAGSWVAISHITGDGADAQVQADHAAIWQGAMHQRSGREILGMFAGAELAQPGLVDVELWRPDKGQAEEPGPLRVAGGVAIKR
jgi:S-adenosyl methyltransferase